MFIDLSPIKNNSEFRKLFLGQTISFLGSMITYVSIPYQIYELSKNSFLVGLVATVQLIPLLIAGLYGGALADSLDRRKLLINSEIGLLICSLLFIVNCLLPQPSIIFIFILAGISSGLVGLHRPAMDALVPQIVSSVEMNSVSALGSLRYAIGAVAGPALGGVLISQIGLSATYAVDALTFLISIYSLYKMKSISIPEPLAQVSFASIKEGLNYAFKTPVIMGTYLVDIIAMVFAMPIALFPQIADEFGAKKDVGILYAAIPVGAAVISLFSKPLDKIKRQGAGVILAATVWGVFITLMAFGKNIYAMGLALLLAGAADSISAIFRGTIWNEVIPTNIRGRLGSLNMLSYMIGPLLGNMRAGTMASISNTYVSILSGGLLCTLACLSCIWIFPQFWSYVRNQDESKNNLA